jgi:hypothetical protein
MHTDQIMNGETSNSRQKTYAYRIIQPDSELASKKNEIIFKVGVCKVNITCLFRKHTIKYIKAFCFFDDLITNELIESVKSNLEKKFICIKENMGSEISQLKRLSEIGVSFGNIYKPNTAANLINEIINVAKTISNDNNACYNNFFNVTKDLGSSISSLIIVSSYMNVKIRNLSTSANAKYYNLVNQFFSNKPDLYININALYACLSIVREIHENEISYSTEEELEKAIESKLNIYFKKIFPKQKYKRQGDTVESSAKRMRIEESDLDDIQPTIPALTEKEFEEVLNSLCDDNQNPNKKIVLGEFGNEIIIHQS